MELLYTVKEASQILRVNPNRVYELIDSGLLVALKLGRYKIPKAELERFVRDNTGKDLSDLKDIKALS